MENWVWKTQKIDFDLFQLSVWVAGEGLIISFQQYLNFWGKFYLITALSPKRNLLKTLSEMLYMKDVWF